MKIGFTGTRDGMTRSQASQLQYVLAVLYHADKAVGRRPEFHFGQHETVELKSDVEAAQIANELGFDLRPHYARRGEELARDKRQALDCTLTIAAPKTNKEQQRSGTWATVRYTQALSKPVILLAR